MKEKRGQALVEFIIILPILIMIFFGSIDFGRIVIRKNELESLTTDVVKMYEEDCSFEKIEDFLKINNKDNTLKITNKDNNYIEFELGSNIELITPGLGKIIGEPYVVKTKRVIYYEK